MKHSLDSHLDAQGAQDTLAYENEDMIAYVSIAGFLAMTVVLLIVISLS